MHSLAQIESPNFRSWPFLMVAVLWACACTERVDWPLEYQEADLIVVEAKLTNEVKRQEVRLTRPIYGINGIPDAVTDALVEIWDGRQLHQFAEDPTRPGVYLSTSGLAGEVNSGYQLRIRHGEKRINAVSFMRKVEPFQPMWTSLVQEDPPLYEVYISDQNGPSIVRLELDWSHVYGYDTLPEDQTHALIYHYTLGGVDVNRIFAPEQEKVRFPPGTRIFREKESVSREYEEYLRGMLSETEWRGGLFDVLPGNARTNLSEGAIGYFTACEVIRDTVLIE
jgi:hypothetical protein